jgi:hypothetical protein
MSAEIVPTSDLSPAERVVSEIEAAKAAGDIGRVMDGIEGLDAVQRFLRRRKEQRDVVNRAGAEKVRAERWIGLCVLNGQVRRADTADISSALVGYFRYFARVPEEDFEQAIAGIVASRNRTVTTHSVYRDLQLHLNPDAEKNRRALEKRRADERRLRDLGRREMERKSSKAHVRMRARPLEVALGAIHEALAALEEFELRDENERVAYDDALRMLHGAEDFVKITAGFVHGAPSQTG